MGANAQHSFNYLKGLDQQYRVKANPLPVDHIEQPWWSGLLVQIGDSNMVCQQQLIAEVISLPRYSYLPAARPWVIGVANLRGEPLPLIDLSLFFNTTRRETRNRRVLVLRQANQVLGLVVDGVHGMHRILDDEPMRDLECPIVACRTFAKQALMIRRKQHWFFDLKELLNDENFLNVARQTTRVRNV